MLIHAYKTQIRRQPYKDSKRISVVYRANTINYYLKHS